MAATPEIWVQFLPLIGAAIALLCLRAAFRDGRKRWLVENLPTCKTTGVFIGLVELKGTAETTQPLTSFLAGQACVQYHWRIEEEWSRTVSETYTDSEGKTQTRTREESGWTTVGEGAESIPFYLQDDCGSVLVRPAGAKTEPQKSFDETCGPSDPLYYGKGPPRPIADSTHRRHFAESILPLHAQLYVMGQARERTDVVAPEIAQDPAAPVFLISTRSEAQIRRGYAFGQWGWVTFGLCGLVGGFLGRDAARQMPLDQRWPGYLVPAAAYLAAAAGTWVWMVYNGLIDLRNRVAQAWAQIEIQLKRRHDLIPNLVEIVQAYSQHEKSVQSELAELRGQLSATPPGVAGADFRAVQPLVAAVVEKYPTLKANELFSSLQKNLVATEQRIALARGYFNEIATHYNTRLEILPEKFVAQLGSLRPQVLMAANEFERAPLEVNQGPVAI